MYSQFSIYEHFVKQLEEKFGNLNCPKKIDDGPQRIVITIPIKNTNIEIEYLGGLGLYRSECLGVDLGTVCSKKFFLVKVNNNGIVTYYHDSQISDDILKQKSWPIGSKIEANEHYSILEMVAKIEFNIDFEYGYPLHS